MDGRFDKGDVEHNYSLQLLRSREEGASQLEEDNRSSGLGDLKMDFTRKAQWVKDGHRTLDPSGSNLLVLFLLKVFGSLSYMLH